MIRLVMKKICIHKLVSRSLDWGLKDDVGLPKVTLSAAQGHLLVPVTEVT